MTITHSAVGILALALPLNVALNAVLPPVPQLPIHIDQLAYHDGLIRQSRTVTASGPFTAVWSASVISVTTGKTVPGCAGSGVWDYMPGAKTVELPLAEWVGSADCALAPGRYQPMATYRAGTFVTDHRGAVFEVPG